MDIKEQIKENLKKTLKELEIGEFEPEVGSSGSPLHGDYTTNAAMTVFASSKFIPIQSGQNSKFGSPRELAEEIANLLNTKYKILNTVDKVEVAGPGFINFWISKDYLSKQLKEVLNQREEVALTSKSKNKRIMVEFAHPNTHKEMHIGHMRTLITGEALARLFDANGAKVFRANYQGDIGPHVAKAIYGVRKIIKDEGLTLEAVGKWTNEEKAHFLGKGYVLGNQEYEARKEEIDKLNSDLYSKSQDVSGIYQTTRQWSLDYYEDFYRRFYTKFDRLFFESEMVECGKKIVKENIGKVFKEDDGAVIFPGEEYGLHTRVFITQAGNPTYEGKEMCNGFKEYEAFPFDKKIHVVGSEQAGYFQIVFKALELIDPEKFKDKQIHISMGMVQLAGPSTGSEQARKMSSRTGDILKVDWLINKVKEKVSNLMKEGRIEPDSAGKVSEDITIGAIKYSVLRVGTGQDVAFDIEKSVSLDGNSGPYLQYTYARTRSVLAKSQISNLKSQIQNLKFKTLENEEESLLRALVKFDEAVAEAGEKMAPNVLCNYLFDLAQKFNLFYQKCPILKGESTEFRIALTEATGIVLKQGLNLLGIQSPERM